MSILDDLSNYFNAGVGVEKKYINDLLTPSPYNPDLPTYVDPNTGGTVNPLPTNTLANGEGLRIIPSYCDYLPFGSECRPYTIDEIKKGTVWPSQQVLDRYPELARDLQNKTDNLLSNYQFQLDSSNSQSSILYVVLAVAGGFLLLDFFRKRY